jgi:anti-sigma factor ChrR (cupin superfamily)
MIEKSGFQIARVKEIPWEDRVNVDNWPSRAGMYYDDRENELCVRLIDYPAGSIEPRHVHAGSHAATVLKGHAIVDGLTLGPLDVVLGPGGEPHGPLNYPNGCNLFSAFLGSYYHSEVEHMSTEKRYRLIQQAKLPWERSNGAETKTLVDHGLGRLLLQALRYAPGATLAANATLPFQSALVVEGGAAIEDENLGVWDFIRVPDAKQHGTISFPKGATLLAVTLR